MNSTYYPSSVGDQSAPTKLSTVLVYSKTALSQFTCRASNAQGLIHFRSNAVLCRKVHTGNLSFVHAYLKSVEKKTDFDSLSLPNKCVLFI